MGEGCDDEPEEGKKGQEKTKEPPPVRSGTFKSLSQVHKHCQRHNGPRILSPKLELSQKAETNANSNLAL